MMTMSTSTSSSSSRQTCWITTRSSQHVVQVLLRRSLCLPLFMVLYLQCWCCIIDRKNVVVESFTSTARSQQRHRHHDKPTTPRRNGRRSGTSEDGHQSSSKMKTTFLERSTSTSRSSSCSSCSNDLNFDWRLYSTESGDTNTNDSGTLTTTTDAADDVAWDMEELEEFCSNRGVVVSFTTLGPGYRAVARAQHNTSLILGYVEGFVRPSGNILHIDKMEIFQPSLKRAKQEVTTKNPGAFDFGGISFGIGLVMGYRCLLHGVENGCKKAEFLAIDDEEKQHKRLVRYYRQVGFNVVKYVGDGFKDIPDRLIWGGAGTLMDGTIDEFCHKWTNLMKLMQQRTKQNMEKE